MIDMHDKIVAVTGANSGEEARAWIAERATGPPPQLFIADLSSQEQIRELARDIHFAYDQIDVLLNNAGGVFAKRELTARRPRTP